MAIAYNATHYYLASTLAIGMFCLEKAAGAPVLQTQTGATAGAIATLNVDDSTGLTECVASTNAGPEPPLAAGTFITGADGAQYVILQPLALLASAGVTFAILARKLNEPLAGPVLLKIVGGGTALAKVSW